MALNLGLESDCAAAGRATKANPSAMPPITRARDIAAAQPVPLLVFMKTSLEDGSGCNQSALATNAYFKGLPLPRAGCRGLGPPSEACSRHAVVAGTSLRTDSYLVAYLDRKRPKRIAPLVVDNLALPLSCTNGSV